MVENPYHPHALEVVESAKKPGTFEWSIRSHGKLAERGDKTFATEELARSNGVKAIERLVIPQDDRRRR